MDKILNHFARVVLLKKNIHHFTFHNVSLWEKAWHSTQGLGFNSVDFFLSFTMVVLINKHDIYLLPHVEFCWLCLPPFFPQSLPLNLSTPDSKVWISSNNFYPKQHTKHMQSSSFKQQVNECFSFVRKKMTQMAEVHSKTLTQGPAFSRAQRKITWGQSRFCHAAGCSLGVVPFPKLLVI